MPPSAALYLSAMNSQKQVGRNQAVIVPSANLYTQRSAFTAKLSFYN